MASGISKILKAGLSRSLSDNIFREISYRQFPYEAAGFLLQTLMTFEHNVTLSLPLIHKTCKKALLPGGQESFCYIRTDCSAVSISMIEVTASITPTLTRLMTCLRRLSLSSESLASEYCSASFFSFSDTAEFSVRLFSIHLTPAFVPSRNIYLVYYITLTTKMQPQFSKTSYFRNFTAFRDRLKTALVNKRSTFKLLQVISTCD